MVGADLRPDLDGAAAVTSPKVLGKRIRSAAMFAEFDISRRQSNVNLLIGIRAVCAEYISRLSAGRTQQLRHPRIHLCKHLLALGVANTGLQFFQEGDETLQRRLRDFVLSPERRAYCTANAIQLACIWPGVHGGHSHFRQRGAAHLSSDVRPRA
jgi:hypothetical protein